MGFTSKVFGIVGAVSCLAGSASAEDRVYYYAPQLLGHLYFLDNHLGMRYAAERFGVEVRTIGSQGWAPAGHAEAVEQAFAKEPAGIMTSLWEPGVVPASNRAMEQGIPAVVIEATAEDHGALTFIRLDNYQSGSNGRNGANWPSAQLTVGCSGTLPGAFM